MNISEKIILNKKLLDKTVNFDAVFSDESVNYMNPNEPSDRDCVRVRLRVGTNEADAVFFVSEGTEEAMTVEKTDGMFDYYSLTVPPENKNRRYLFKINSAGRIFYYNRYGISEEKNEAGSFVIDRNYKTPDWTKNAVGYQIFTDRFCNGDLSNDVTDHEYVYLGQPVHQIKDWEKTPDESDVFNFYGGDLQGVINRLDYLSALGINMIYLNPIFVSPSNHKYDIQDYEHIDPHIGKIVKDSDTDRYAVRTVSDENLNASDALFALLVKAAHEHGIRVIIDGVFNHCGSFHQWMDREMIYEKAGKNEKGAFLHRDSRYRNYFMWNEDGQYDSWWGHFNHPKLYYENSPELFDYMMNIAQKWLKPPYNADGWRIDVAADLGYSEEFNHQFWKEFRKKVKEVSKDAVIIAEHYGDASHWLEGDEWDTVMNYDAFMEPVSWFFTGMEKHSDSYRGDLIANGKAFEDAMTYNSAKLNSHAVRISMNQLSNHDHSRFLTRTNKRVGRLASAGADAAEEGINLAVLREAVLFQFLWTGIPTIYYGDEAGVTGWTDPDNRRTYPWGHENHELLEFHRIMIHIRKSYRVLSEGSCRFIYSDYGTAAVARFDDDHCMIAVFNNTSEQRTIILPVWKVCAHTEGILEYMLTSDADGYSLIPSEHKIEHGLINIEINGYGAVLLKNK